MKDAKEARTDPSVGIDEGRLYRGSDARRLTGMGPVAWRRAIRNGLCVRRVGRTQFVHGKDLVAWVSRQPAEAPEQATFPFMREEAPDA